MTTARVEVLTAEVRTLQVGNRQVTLSIFRQLDYVRPGEIEPFGRVRDGQSANRLDVVGRRRLTGDLVRSTCSPRRQQYDSLVAGEVEDDPHWTAWQSLPLIVLAGLR